MEENIKAPEMLPLDQARIITLKAKSTSYVFRTRLVSEKDWTEYFGDIVNQVITIDGRRSEIIESDTALLALVDRVLVSVEGYGEHGVKDWRAALPIQHRMAVGMALRAVGPSAADDTPALCDLAEVKLDATWPLEGGTKLFGGLVHRFRHPSIEQLKRFNFEASRVQTRGDGDNGISTYPSRQIIAMKLYDELIESVEGYSMNGRELNSIEEIRRAMDGAHKATAALQIFAGGDVRVI